MAHGRVSISLACCCDTADRERVERERRTLFVAMTKGRDRL